MLTAWINLGALFGVVGTWLGNRRYGVDFSHPAIFSTIKDWRVPRLLAWLLVIISMSTYSQSKPGFSRSDLDSSMRSMVKQFNEQMAGTRVDDQTVIRMMVYDTPVPTLTYIYATKHYATTGLKSVDQEHAQALRKYHIEKTCSSDFAAFMRAFKLEVTHSFEDATTGRRLFSVTVRGSDCVK